MIPTIRARSVGGGHRFGGRPAPMLSRLFGGATIWLALVAPVAATELSPEPDPQTTTLGMFDEAAVGVPSLVPVGGVSIGWERLATQGAQAPAVDATGAAARAAERAAQATTVLGRRPSFGAQVEHIERLQPRETQTPFGVQQVDPRAVWQAGARLDVPILRWSDQSLRPQSAQADARAAALQQAATTQAVVANARGLWLAQQRVHAQAGALWEQRRALQQLETQLATMVAASRTVPAELARVRLAIDEVDIELRALQQALTSLAWGLAGVLGSETPLYAAIGLPTVPLPTEDASAAPLRAQVALAQADGARLAARAARWDDLPTITLQAGWEWTDLDTLVENHSLYGAVVLQWQPDISRGRHLAAQAHDAQADAAEAQARAAALEAASAMAAARALAEEADDRLTVLSRSLQDAQMVVAVARVRYDAGAVTLVEVLDATATLARIQAAVALAEIQRVQAWVDASAVSASVR